MQTLPLTARDGEGGRLGNWPQWVNRKGTQFEAILNKVGPLIKFKCAY